MEAWGWIVVFVVGLTALQLLLYRYLAGGGNVPGEARGLMSNGDDSNRTTPNPERSGDFRTATLGRRVDRGRDAGDGRQCPQCGAENEAEQAYSRCWNCARRIA